MNDVLSLLDDLSDVSPIGPIERFTDKQLKEAGLRTQKERRLPHDYSDDATQVHIHVDEWLDSQYGEPVTRSDSARVMRIGEGKFFRTIKKYHVRKTRKLFNKACLREIPEHQVFVVGVQHNKENEGIVTLSVLGLPIDNFRVIMSEERDVLVSEYIAEIAGYMKSLPDYDKYDDEMKVMLSWSK